MTMPPDEKDDGERLVENREVAIAWVKEATRRRDDVRAGKVQTIPGEQVLAEIRQLLAK